VRWCFCQLLLPLQLLWQRSH